MNSMVNRKLKAMSQASKAIKNLAPRPYENHNNEVEDTKRNCIVLPELSPNVQAGHIQRM